MSEYKYQSPIELIQSEMKMRVDDGIVKAVQEVGVNVDKGELLKALAYDRDQYNKGYHDAEPKWIPCEERTPNETKATYLICTDNGYMCSCRWTNVNPFWTDLTTEWHWNLFDIPQYSKVVAWMPLKPYEMEREEE